MLYICRLAVMFLVPKSTGGAGLPTEVIGPLELRSETVAGALQLILADYEVFYGVRKRCCV